MHVITEVDERIDSSRCPSGRIEVTADLSGFGTLTTRNVEVNVSTPAPHNHSEAGQR